MMSGNLSHFLVDLVSNPDRMAAYLADPDRVFEEAGLTPQEREAIRSRDGRKLDEALTDGFRLQSFVNNDMPTARKPARKRKSTTKKKKPAAKKPTRRKKSGAKKRSKR
jgi:Aromatic-ring-opening dioxygenase LigAB, LigA subunit